MVVHLVGRKRKDAVKKAIRLSVDADILEALEKDGVNKSRLFSIAAKKYLRSKSREND